MSELSDAMVTVVLFWAYACGVTLIVLGVVCAYYWLEEHSNPVTDWWVGRHRKRALAEIDALYGIPVMDGSEWPSWPSSREGAI
jgi:hypothetical protein